jgi:porin
VLGERTLLRLGGDEARYLSGFARYTWGDGDSTAVKNSLNLGLHLKGPWPRVPTTSSAWPGPAPACRRNGATCRPSRPTRNPVKSALEITWRFAVTPYLAIQPNYQYIRNPGGASAPNAKLIGVRLDAVL